MLWHTSTLYFFLYGGRQLPLRANVDPSGSPVHLTQSHKSLKHKKYYSGSDSSMAGCWRTRSSLISICLLLQLITIRLTLHPHERGLKAKFLQPFLSSALLTVSMYRRDCQTVREIRSPLYCVILLLQVVRGLPLPLFPFTFPFNSVLHVCTFPCMSNNVAKILEFSFCMVENNLLNFCSSQDFFICSLICPCNPQHLSVSPHFKGFQSLLRNTAYGPCFTALHKRWPNYCNYPGANSNWVRDYSRSKQMLISELLVGY